MIVGELVNSRYDIKMLIGDGGMANVYLANDRILRKKVAIKMLRFELSKDEKFIKRFRREAEQVTQLNHENIVKSLAVGDYKGQPFIAMEYIKGNTLKDFLKSKVPLSTTDAIDKMEQIARGVAYAHKKGIIHRDLKSQNIMLGDDGDVKIADFGIALSSNEAEMTQTNTIMGSVHYLAPELARGNIATESSDIYSLGIILYEILTGSVPFKGEGAVNIALQHLEGSIKPIEIKNEEGLTENLNKIIKKCTHKKASNRYPNAVALLEDLEIAHIPGAVTGGQTQEEDEDLDKTMILPNLDDDNVPEEKKEKKPRKKKKISLLNISLAILYTALLAMLTTLFFIVVVNPTTFSTEHAVVPNVMGMTVEAATEALEEAGFDEPTVQTVTNTSVSSGEVFRANPPIGVRVRLHDEQVITIFVAD